MRRRTLAGAPACDVSSTRARLEEELEDWADGRGALPAWAKVIAREAGVKADTVEEATADKWTRKWLEKELTDQVSHASSSQVCGYGFVWNKYTGEGRRFRRRLARTKLAGMRRRRSRK